jgi:hypothetical protein
MGNDTAIAVDVARERLRVWASRTGPEWLRRQGTAAPGHSFLPFLAAQPAATGTARRDRLREWATKVEKARGHNKAAVALANKMARMVWAVWRHDRDYQPTPVAA